MNALRALIQYVTAPFRLVLGWPIRIIGAPRRLMGMSLPARVAVLLAIFLVICTLTVVIAFILRKDVPHGDVLTDPKWIILVIVLLIAIPWVTYLALRLWLEGDVSKYPDIDRAWNEGIAALAENGFDVADYPLFLVIGAPDEKMSDTLLGSARLNLVVSGVPSGRAPLRWYATDQGIFLVCRGLGRLGRLNELAASTYQERPASAPQQAGGASIKGTMVVGAGPVRQSGPPTGTVVEDEPLPSAPAIQGTLVAGVAGTMMPDSGGGAPAPPPSSDLLSRKEAEEQSDRLEYVCQRLCRVRQPYASNNGVLTLLPLPVVRDILVAKNVPDAVRHDIDTIRETTKLLSPVTTLVCGMESQAGFSELVQRVGLDKAKASRFGKGFQVWNSATDENLDALSSHACGAFEDWVYTLFREKGGLEQTGNNRLFRLLCEIRRQLQPRIRNILVRGFAADEDDASGDPQLFSGCYLPRREARRRNVRSFAACLKRSFNLKKTCSGRAVLCERSPTFAFWPSLGYF